MDAPGDVVTVHPINTHLMVATWYIRQVANSNLNRFVEMEVGQDMSNVCEICGKHPVAGRSISHSHRVSNRVFKPNIQKVTIKEKNGHVRKARICTSCLKAGKVERA